MGMPTPHRHHGLAFGTREVAVLRRALALAMKAAPTSEPEESDPGQPDPRPRPAPAALDFWLLDQAIAEAESERDRLRSFELAELTHHRTALPGAAATYLTTLERVVAQYAYIPTAEDLAALRTLAELPCGTREQARRQTLLAHGTARAEHAMEIRLAERAARRATPDPAHPPTG